jgi:hypothetical protein
MRKVMSVSALVFFATIMVGGAAAQNMVIYPAQGQSQEQMDKDKSECYSWAKQQTGFDPMQAASGSQPAAPAPSGGGERVRGAARGAAVGAVAGGIAGDAGKGAAAGAAAGTMAGGMQKRQNRRQQAQAAQQQGADMAQKQNDYNRAFGTCLEGRGYTVK